MYDENQIVQVRWNNSNKEWYESKGYIFTKRNSFFDVYVKDLSPHSSKKINVVCDYCGNEYKTQYAMVVNGRKIIQKDCCSKCTGKKTSEVSKIKRAKKYIEKAQKICDEYGYILITTIDDYIDAKMNIDFICPKHGKQTMMLDNLIHGHKCRLCSYEERGNNLKHSIQFVKKSIESINGNKLLNPQDYKDTFTNNLNIQCSCGNIFTTSFSNYTKHNVNTCFSCSCKESSGEKRIKEFLKLNNINFIQEKRFDDCRNIKPLPFDFYLPDYNMCIEFDGQQHYKDVGFGNYEKTKKHDIIKNEYCKNNNIDLLRIPYWEGNSIENIIVKHLNL